ncbi:hypothetical protein AOLI_G00095610 [Acnodon oligacanthus]
MGVKSFCPICKTTELNLKSKEPPNHNTCTQCKSVVCSMCGFSPPDADAKEWLCLNCQMQRALGGAEPPGPPMMKTPSQPSKSPSPSQPPGKQSASLAQKKDTTQNKVLPQPANQQNKPSEGQKAPEQFSSSAAKQASATATPPSQQKPSQQQTAKGGPSLGKSEPPPKAEPPEEQSGFFGFGFGGARSRSPSPQPAVSAVSGKVLGFGSSFLSSASNLISSAVQDEPSTTPPTSRKGSAVSQTSAKAVTTPPASHKGSEPSKDSPKPPATYKQEEMKAEKKKPEEPQPTKATVAQTKNQPTSTQPSKLNPVSPKPIPKACPICKVDLKKDPPNYSACTECKSTVCNQCGFNPTPHQSEEKHWVCLNCQTQRALKGVEPQGPPSLKPLPQPSEATTQKKDSTTSQTQKQSTAQPTKPSFADQTVTPKETLKQQPSSTGAKPLNQQKPPDQQAIKSGPPTAKSEPASKEEPPHNESSFFGFGFGARSRSPSPQPAASAVSGKVLGFGSSLFSSASNLISSAVQDEPSTTPPTSRKGSTVSQSSANSTNTPPTSRKVSSTGTETKQPTAQKEKTDRQLNDQKAKAPLSQSKMPELSTHMPKVDKDAHSVPKACPLCKAELKKDPPNYNICTECKKAVCNLCGFNPMPHQTEVLEWLCLNCQTQRALGDELMSLPKNPGPPQSLGKGDKAPSSQQIGASVVDSTKKTANPKATAPQEDKKVDVVQKLQDKQTKALNGTPPVHKPQWQETEKPHVGSQRQSKTVKSETQEESGFFGFGFGGARSRSPSPQPAVSAVSGKVLGFGSSFLNSASNLISSAVQDEPSTVPPTSRKGSSVSQTSPKTTPPTSRKGSSVSQISHKPESPASTPAASRKGSETSQDVKRMLYSKDTKPPSDHQSGEVKAQQVQPSKTPSTQAKRDQPFTESAAADKSAQSLPQTCPLCKAEIKKDPPNYRMCTECKSTVCSLCGFNPMPHQAEVKEWLCLKCQTQRASEALSVQSQQQAKKMPPSLQQKEAATSEGPQKKGLPDETIKKGQKTAAVKQPADMSAVIQEKQLNPTPTQQPNQQLPIKQKDAEKPQSQTSKSGPSPAKADPSQESSGFFGFGGARSRSPSPQPAVSAVSGKVLGFGSSLFSSASNLISSAVQDEPSTTPPTSRKGSQVSQSSIKTATPPSSRKGSGVSQTSIKTTVPPPTSRKGSETPEGFQKKQTGDIKSQTKQNQEDITHEKTKSVIHQGKESSQGAESKPELSKVKETSQLIPKDCPLCKVEIKKEPPNYNTCTHCKNIVCIQCGFNPTPHQTEVKEWLCLNCQMQRAPGPPPAQPQAQVTKVPPPVSLQKKEASAPEKDKSLVAHEKPEDKQVEADKKQPLNTHNTKQQLPVKPQQTKDAMSERPKEESGFFGFGFGSRSRSPSPQPAVSGKVLGFGSSILSSASNLISSAVQDGPSTTPSTSRKNSTVSQTSEKTAPTSPTSRKGSEASQTCKPTATPPVSHGVPTQESPKMNPKNVTKPPNEQDQKENLEEKKPGVKKTSPKPEPISKDTHTTKPDTTKAVESTQALPKVCPLCKVEIKKDPPNYNVCTECKNVVCNLCGFNPAPDQTEVKVWLCLNCQMQQASGPPKPVQPQSTKAPPPASPQKDVQAQGSLQRSPQLQESKGTPLEQRLTVDVTKEGQKHVAGKPDDKSPGAQSQKSTSPKPSPAKSPPPPKAEPANEESGFFGLGFGGARSRSPSPQTAASAVSGKLLGFSSSIISSASNLITSAVQDEPSTTPPTSRKGSAVSQTSIKTAPTPPASRKGSVLQTSPKLASSDETKATATQKKEEKKPADDAQKAHSAKAPSAPVKGDENLSNLPKMCPLCKEKFTHPPNYNTCTSCKATVCNLCGFNPTPHRTEVKEWLCLNCQMQQAPGLLPAQPQPGANKVSPPAPKKEAPTAGPTQKAIPSGGATEKDQKPVASEKPNDKSISAEPQKPTTASAEQKPPVAEFVPPQKPELNEEQSGFFGFGFGGARSRSPSPHSAASAVSGKVLGFGSSFLSSASNLISSAVQDESSTTPPTSRKGSTISQNLEKKVPTPPSSRKASVAQKQEENKSEDHVAKAPVSLMKNTPPLQIPKACPLCMVDLKKDPPNYNTCTECNSIVCNLCGFSPIPQKTEVKEWLCLTCQMKRAPGPPPAQPQPLANKVSPPAPPQKKETPDVSQKKLVDATKTDQKPTVTEKPEDKTIPVENSMAVPLTQQPAPEGQKAPEQSISTTAKQASTTAPPTQQKPSQQQTAKGGPSPAMSEPPPKAELPKEESGFFGFGGARSRSPSPQAAASAVSGKVLGFGSSFLSSASNFISSAVQDEPSTTPPASRKGSTVSQSSVKNVPTPPPSRKGSVAQKKEERKEPGNKSEEQLTKAAVSQMKKDEPPSEPLGDCPLCKVQFKKDPPNYNTCTECKNTVCNLCGFSPMPQQTEVKEWLCLNCQMKRAPGPPSAKPQSQADKVPPPVSPQKKEAPTPGVPQKKPSLPVDVGMKDQKSPTPEKKEDKPNPDESQKSTAVPSTQQPAIPQKVVPPKEESGFLGFGGARSRSPSPQAAASAVSGKVLGFGSSFLSSASNFISSAVQDEPSTTPPASRKEPLGDCSLCKVQFKKDPPNYNTCTECKNTVCNLCGFSPMPQQTEVKEWLCLNCQMKRAPGPPSAKPQSQADKVPPPVSPQKKEAPTPGVPQKKPSLPVDVGMKDQKSPTPEKKEDKPNPDESQKSTAVPSTQQPAIPQKVVPPKEESGFLGFGGARSRSPSPQAAASAVSGKVLGFGSSFLSSASNFISSAVQDEPSTTPPVSRKGSTVSQSSVKNVPTPPPSRKGSVAQKKEERKEPENKSEEKLTKAAVSQMKKDEPPSEPLGDCPLCKVQFKKDPPNYNTCTECKNTVCNLCGFSPMPQQTVVKEWLCLNCQMKRAPGPPPAQPQSQADKVPPQVSPQKKEVPTPGDAKMKVQKPATPGKKEDKPNPDESQKSTQQPAPATPANPQKVEPPKMESGFFGFGGARSRSPSPQAAASAVSGKVLGFGSSFLSSASNLISSAVQDEPSTTPPTSRKGSTVSAKITPTPPASRKASVAQTKEEKKEMEMKPEDQSKVPTSLVKKDESIKQCPLCKVDIKKDPPNYNTCTECKNIVCNLCGFSPMPQQTEMKRAPGAPLVQPQQEPNKVPPPASPQKKEASPVGKLDTQTDTKKPISTPTSLQPSIAESAPPPKSEASKEESSFFSFGFGGPRSRPSSPQPAASAVSGKVLGFGSSIFSTASNLISSAVHDEASTTPPPSRKDSTASMKTPSSPASRKASVEPEKIPQGTKTKISAEETKTSTTKKEQEKKLGEIVPDDSTKVVAPSKAQHVVCPICKQELNVGSNEVPNYNTCTECKNTVCNLCGFNPVPHQTEVFEWLCLNCQTQRALKGMEPPVTKPQAEPDTDSTSIQPPKSPTPKTATDAGETNKKELTQVQKPPKDVSAAAMLDENKAPVPPGVKKENILITDIKKEDTLLKVEDKTAEKKETQIQLSSTVEGVSTQRPSSEMMLVKEDQKAAGPQKPIIDQEAVGQPTDTGAEKGRVLEKPEKPQTTPSPQEQKTLKQGSGFFGFGFGSAKSQPAPSKASETSNKKLGSLTETPSAQSVSAVSGKVLGFGSSILSSASNLISSAVQDESSTTPPSSRKGSSVSQTAVKTPTPPTSRRGSTVSQASVKTPPTSRKGSVASQASLRMLPTKDTKSSGAQMLDQKKPDQKSDVKLDGTPEAAKSSAPLQPATKPIQSSCPICKIELNIGSVDPPNFNICTECKNSVCSQCGFDPMPDQTKVKEWLCLNCQMQRTVRATEPPGTSMLKPTSSEKDSQAPPAAHTLTEPKPGVSSPTPVSEKNIPVPSPSKKDIPAPTTVQTDLKQPPSKELSQQKAPAQEKPSKPQPEIAKGTPSPIKSAPPPQAEAPKQESSFFGFGFGKSQPTPAKTSDSMTGKLFGFGGLTETASRSPSPQSVTNVSGKVLGFGSSIFSSASNLISSAVQDEPASSPPTSRKGSTVSQSSGKTSTPPTSRKGSAASQASLRMTQGEPKAPVFKKPDEKKTEEPHLTKALPVTAKQEVNTEPDKIAAPSEPPSKATPSICQLCKVELNVGSKEPPNYNTCTECKDVVCNLCGFNPMPHLAETMWDVKYGAGTFKSLLSNVYIALEGRKDWR